MESKSKIDYLLDLGAREFGIELSNDKTKNFSTYLKELQEWNKKINLTGISEKNEIIKKHFLDSLSCVLVIKDLSDKIGIDIGTGAGFPGIPLKICFHQFKVTLVDSSIKKIKFLEHIAKILKLTDIEILYGRTENFAKTEHREKYDIVLARAIAELPSLIEICMPFVKIGGIFIVYKSEKVDEEIENSQKILSIVGGKLKEKKEVRIPFLSAKRYLIVIEKEKSTPMKYPRRPGIPQKRPIL